jgi:hypothetical protein
MKTLLVATTPEAQDSILKNLGGSFEIIFCTSMQDAFAALIGPVDLIACSIHFGEGAVYDLLRYVKSSPDTKTIPFVAIYGSDVTLSSPMRQSIEIATRALGADAFVELARWSARSGEVKAYEKLMGIMNDLMADAADKSNWA